MKPRNGPEGRSTSPSPPRDLASQDRVLQQIKTITQEIEVLQREIYERMREPQAAAKRRTPAEDAGAARVVATFKVALDRMRHVLWFYIEQLAAKGETNFQLRRAQERRSNPDRARVPQSTPQSPSAPDPPGSFFERLDMVIDTYMKAAPPTQSNTKKRAKP
jgi:hypothetical protein